MASLLSSLFDRVIIPTRVHVAVLLTRPISTSPIMEAGVKKPKWTGPPFPKRPSASFMVYYKEQYKDLEAADPSELTL